MVLSFEDSVKICRVKKARVGEGGELERVLDVAKNVLSSQETSMTA